MCVISDLDRPIMIRSGSGSPVLPPFILYTNFLLGVLRNNESGWRMEDGMGMEWREYSVAPQIGEKDFDDVSSPSHHFTPLLPPKKSKSIHAL